MNKQAAEIIAFHLGWDINDVKDGLYQRHRSPAVYVCGNDYYCAPTQKQKLPPHHEFEWKQVGEEYGRKIFISRGA